MREGDCGVKPPTHYTTHCPACRARVRLPIKVREKGRDHQMPGNMLYDVAVDATPLREHMKKVHQIGEPSAKPNEEST